MREAGRVVWLCCVELRHALGYRPFDALGQSQIAETSRSCVAQASTALARLSAVLSAEPTVAPTMRPPSHGRQDLEAEEGNMLTRRAIVALAGLLAVAGLAQASVARRHDLMNGLKSLGFHSGAADWPSRPITMVVPFAAGGPTDVV